MNGPVNTHEEPAVHGGSDRELVAVVNDDVIQLRVLTGLLQEDGMQVLSCRSADDALLRMNPDDPPDLIVTDLHMPGIDGWRFCRLLRSAEYPKFNRVPILVNSATFSGEDACQITAESGANAFMPSPINGPCFIKKVRALLRGDAPALVSRVLIVDDSSSLAAVLKDTFENNGYSAFTASTGAEGLGLFKTLLPEMAVLDYHLPDTTGERLLLEMKALNPRTVFIMITMDPRPELALGWMRIGAAAYVRKPFDPAYLINLCENARRERSLLRVEDVLEERTRELRDSEIRYRTVFQNAPEMMCSIDEAGRFCDVNRKWLEQMGYRRSEVIGKPMNSFLYRNSAGHPPPGSNESVPFSITEGGCQDQPCRYVKKGGAVIDVLIKCEIVPDPIVRRMRLCVIRDITEQKRNERIRIGRSGVLEKMTTSAFLPEVLTTLVEVSEEVKPDMLGMVLLFDCETGGIRHWIAPRLADAIDRILRAPESAALVDHPLIEVCKRKRVIVEDIHAETENDGFHALLRNEGFRSYWSEPILSSEGEARGVFAMFARRPCAPDLPDSEFMRGTAQLAALAIERKRVEDALRESEDRYRSLVERSPIPILVHSGERVVFVNREAVKAFGAGSGEMLLNKRVLDLVHPGDREKVTRRMRLMYGGKAPVPMIEERLLRLNGECFDAEVAATPVDFMGKPASQVVFRNITDRKKAEAERLKLEIQIQKFESLTVMAGSIAHSFNNLLMGVMGNIDLAMQHLDAESSVRKSLISACKSAKRASELSTLMLTYTGKKQGDKTLLDLVYIVEEMIEVLEEVSVSRKAVMKFHPVVESAYISGDPIQIRELIMQLMINASEALGNDGGTITLTLDKRFCDPRPYGHPALKTDLAEGEYVFLEVADTGCGINPETAAKVFDPFFTTKFMGRGMGLAMVLGVIRAHRGGISLTSEPGKGTEIRIIFPALRTRTRPAVNKPSACDGENWRGYGKVLLVDDDEVVLGVGRMMLEKLGFEVVTAADGFEAVSVFKRHAPQWRLVVLDLSMPRMDGEEAFRAIHNIRADIPVLLSSGYTEEHVALRFSEPAPAGFLHKPYRLSALSEIIRQVLSAGQGCGIDSGS